VASGEEFRRAHGLWSEEFSATGKCFTEALCVEFSGDE
jgi:hypothetical protein